MMSQDNLSELRKRFFSYVATFKTGDANYDSSILLKEEHTQKVCQEIVYIGENLELGRADLQLAQIMALFHDFGRFEQFARYRTFADAKSVNHAEFGVELLKEKGMLKEFDDTDQDLVLRAITYHNRLDLPQDETDRCLFFSKLLRDADKLDVWRVFVDQYDQRDGQPDSAVVHGFNDTPDISDTIYSDLTEGKIVKYAEVRNLNDFKLLQLGWIYDVNFTPTFRRIRERGYLDVYRDVLPRSEQTDRIFSAVRSYLETKTKVKLSE